MNEQFKKKFPLYVKLDHLCIECCIDYFRPVGRNLKVGEVQLARFKSVGGTTMLFAQFPPMGRHDYNF